ncbi:MAG: hypothetical protein ACK5PQ_01210 [Alphaproteobacteria bacterium]
MKVSLKILSLSIAVILANESMAVKAFEYEDLERLRRNPTFYDRLQAYEKKEYTLEKVQTEIEKISTWQEYAFFCKMHLNFSQFKATQREAVPQFWTEKEGFLEKGKFLLNEKMRVIFSDFDRIADRKEEKDFEFLKETSEKKAALKMKEKSFFKAKSLFDNWRRVPFSSSEQEAIEIIHGGSLRYLMDFLTGHEKGYDLEFPNRRRTPNKLQNVLSTFEDRETLGLGKAFGIQVHPISAQEDIRDVIKRSAYYAVDRSKPYQDFPVILRATIQPQFLDMADNEYEAGLRSCYVSQLKNIRIEILGYSKRASEVHAPISWKIEQEKAEHMPSDLLKRYLNKFEKKLSYLDLAI